MCFKFATRHVLWMFARELWWGCVTTHWRKYVCHLPMDVSPRFQHRNRYYTHPYQCVSMWPVLASYHRLVQQPKWAWTVSLDLSSEAKLVENGRSSVATNADLPCVLSWQNCESYCAHNVKGNQEYLNLNAWKSQTKSFSRWNHCHDKQWKCNLVNEEVRRVDFPWQKTTQANGMSCQNLAPLTQ